MRPKGRESIPSFKYRAFFTLPSVNWESYWIPIGSIIVPRCYINGSIDRRIHNRTNDTEKPDAVSNRRCVARVDITRSHSNTTRWASRGNGFLCTGNVCCHEDKK